MRAVALVLSFATTRGVMYASVCVCVCVCVCARARARKRACVRVRVRACLRASP